MQSCTVHINIYCVYVPSSCPKELSFLDVGSREVGQHLTKKNIDKMQEMSLYSANRI